MKRILTSWLFFTSLMLFLIVVALTLSQWLDHLFGSTQFQVTQAADYLKEEAQAVWAELIP